MDTNESRNFAANFFMGSLIIKLLFEGLYRLRNIIIVSTHTYLHFFTGQNLFGPYPYLNVNHSLFMSKTKKPTTYFTLKCKNILQQLQYVNIKSYKEFKRRRRCNSMGYCWSKPYTTGQT